MGTPLPGVQVRLMEPESEEKSKPKVLVYGDSKKSELVDGAKSPVNGELQVRGDNVFKKYWNRPEATKNSFTEDGWFKTGILIFLSHKHR